MSATKTKQETLIDHSTQGVVVHRLVRHWLLMIYGRVCHAVWLRLPESIAMRSSLGSHTLGWAGYWANMKWSMPNVKMQELSGGK